MQKSQIPTHKLCATGISGLDEILSGGLPTNRLYLVQGEPGTGKTTLAMQFLLEGLRKGEKCLYITFSETQEELDSVALSHGWDLSKLAVFDLSVVEDKFRPEAMNTVFHPSEVELTETMELILDQVEKHNPSRIVFDSVTELRMLSNEALKYRRQMLSLKQNFVKRNVTVIFLDDLTAAPRDLQVQSIVHGVIHLQKTNSVFGNERRRISIVKLRGVQFLGGFHDYVIERGGVKIFPRMVASGYILDYEARQLSSGIKELDLLLGGGLDVGTSNLFLGPAGTGKSTLAIQYAIAAAERGEAAAVFAFEESLSTLKARCDAIGMDIEKYIKAGLLHVQKINPAELSPGEFAAEIRRRVIKDKLKVVCIDSLNGYIHAMPEEQFLTLQLHELLSFLGNQGVVTVLVLAQKGVIGSSMQTPVDLTYLADTVLITRYFELKGSVRKAVSVIKKRGSMHETTIREFRIGSDGVTVGRPLTELKGILSGIPTMIEGSNLAENLLEGSDD